MIIMFLSFFLKRVPTLPLMNPYAPHEILQLTTRDKLFYIVCYVIKLIQKSIYVIDLLSSH